MHLVWDEGKSRSNRAKHHVSFETAQFVFEDPFALSLQDRTVEGDERWQTLGLVSGRLSCSWRTPYEGEDGEEVIRIISARKATPRERKIYAQAHSKAK